MVRRPDSPNPFAGTGQQVFAPFYEIVASNANNVHYLNGTDVAVVGFCLETDSLPQFPTFGDPAIAHVAVNEGPESRRLRDSAARDRGSVQPARAQLQPVLPGADRLAVRWWIAQLRVQGA